MVDKQTLRQKMVDIYLYFQRIINFISYFCKRYESD